MKKEELLIKTIFDVLKENSDIVSSTVVGSINSMDLEKISDIDIIVIVKKIDIRIINSIKSSLTNIDLNKLDIEKKIFINDTFGPLKFDNKNNLVLHLMIYDHNLHIQHVENSPFTCFDWERSENFTGYSLSEISSVHKLMLNDFVSSRRGTKEYIEDISKNRISYRKYESQNGELVQVKTYYDLDERHAIEFAYHIIYNSISNLLKVNFNKNIKFEFSDFMQVWSDEYEELYGKYNKIFSKLYYLKLNKEIEKLDIVEIVGNFLKDFDFIVNEYLKKSKKIILIRHLKTNLNDGRFLGSENEIDIIENQDVSLELKNFNFSNFEIYTSPSNRCIQTINKLKLGSYNVSDDLKEINYGKADGLFFDEVIDQYKYISDSIEKEDDFKFPEGENNTMVYERIEKFLSTSNQNSALFTHQGVIRCMIGFSLEIPITKWYLINVPHGYPIQFIELNSKYLLNTDRKTFSEIMKNFNAEI
tara:strand:+ start:2349 stop:3773 length:1425 start_codon:yes stop_codon:yes gene_type:complete